MRKLASILLVAFVLAPLGSIIASSPAPERNHVGHAHMVRVSTNVSYNTNTGKYHNSDCRYWGCKNCITISKEEAKRRGGVACKVCNG